MPEAIAATGEEIQSAPEVSHRTGIAIRTIRKWVKEDRFPKPRRLGARIGWLRSEIDRYIAELPTK